MRPLFLGFVLIGVLSFLALPTFSQVNAVSARHETDAQNQITLTLSGNLAALYSCTALGNCNTWTVTIGGVNQTPTSVIGANGSNQVFINFTTPVGIDAGTGKGQTVTVTYTGGGAINNFADLASLNQHQIICSDFAFTGYFDASFSCAPVEPNSQMIFSVKPVARNSQFWTLSFVTGRVNWITVGVAPFSVLASEETTGGGASSTNTYFVGFHTDDFVSASSVPATKYVYPASDPVCGYTSNWNVRLLFPAGQGFTGNCPLSGAAQTQSYASHNNDDTGLGADVLMPATANLSDQVCQGTNANMTFSDNTDLNCNPTTAPIPTNTGRRWVRVVYGATDLGGGNTATSNIPNVHVDGVEVTDVNGILLRTLPDGSPGYSPPVYPFGTPDAFGVVEITAPVNAPRGILNLITTTSFAGQVAGQRFWVRLDYWNGCNPYDGAGDIGNLRRSVLNDVEIIPKPAPPTAVNQEVCNGTTPNPFQVNFPNTTDKFINWYRDVAGVPGTLISSVDVNNAANASLTLVAAGFAATPASGTYSVWASYTPDVTGALNCETEKVKIEIIVRPIPATPGVINGPIEVCNDNATSYNFNETNPSPTVSAPSGFPVGGPTEYRWTLNPGTAGITISGSPGQSVNIIFNSVFAGASTTSPDIRVRSHYNTNTYSTVTCQSNARDKDITIYNPSQGGSIAPVSQPICSGEPITTILASGFRGTIQGWERSVNGSPFAADGSLGVANPITPAVPIIGNATTTYVYRAVIQNGPCVSTNTPTATVIVHPRASDATLSGTATICQGNTTNLSVAVTDGISPFEVVYTDGVSNFTVTGYASGNNIPVSPATTTTYTLVSVSDANGCTPTTVGGAATVTVSNPTSAVIDGDASICPAQSTNFNVVVTGGVGPYTLRYQINMGAPITVNNYVSGSNISTGALATGTYTYTIVDVRDQNTCLSLSNTGSAVVDAGSVPSSATFLGGGSVCRDLPANLSLNITGGVAPFTLIVDNGIGAINNYVSGANIPVPTNVVGTVSYNVTLITDACGSTLGVITNNPQAVTVNDLPAAVSQTPTVCSDNAGGTTATVDLTTLNASINATGTITWFQNYNPGTKVFSTPIGSPSGFVITGGTPVFARVEDGNSCVSPATVTYTVNARPPAPTGAVNVTACSDVVATTAISVSPAGAGQVIDWYAAASGGAALLSNNNSFTPGAAGTYFAETRNTTGIGCVSTSRIAVTLTSDTRPSDPLAQADDQTCGTTYPLTATAADNGGIGFWSTGNTVYYENFDNLPGGAIADNGLFGWTRDITGITLGAGDYFEVRSGTFSSEDLENGTVTAFWRSSPIDVSALSNIDISIDLIKNGSLEASDFIEVYHVLDGTPVKFGEITRVVPDGAPGIVNVTASANGLNVSSNNTLIIEVRIRSNADLEIQSIDNVIVRTAGSSPVTFDDIFDETTTVRNLQDGPNVIQWNVVSALGACSLTPDPVTITKIAVPAAVNLTDDFCEELDMSGIGTGNVTGINLTDYDDDVAGGSLMNRSVLWFSDADRTALIGTPGSITVTDGLTAYAIVTETLSGLGCVSPNGTSDPGRIDFTIHDRPTVVNQTDEFCEDLPLGSNQHAGVNLNSYNASIHPTASITWFETYTLAGEVFGSPIASPGSYTVTDGQTVYARVEDGNGCVSKAEVSFLVHPLQNPNDIIGPSGSFASTITVCKGNAILLFQIDPDLNDDPINGDEPTYSWTIPTGPGQFELFGGGGANDFFVLLKFPNAITGPGLQLMVQETTSRGCTDPGMVNVINIIVEDSPAPPVILGPEEVCADQQNISYSLASSTATSTYTWTVPGALGSIVSGQGDPSIIVNVGPDADGATTIFTPYQIEVIEQSVSGCNSTSPDQHTVRVHDRPTISPLSNLTICSGSSPNENVIMSVPGSTFNWEVLSVSSSVTGINVGNTGTGDIAHTLTNVAAVDGSVTYRITAFSPDIDPAAGTQACQGDQTTLTVRVEPVPQAVPVNNTPRLCNGSSPNIAVSSPTVPTTPANLRFDVTVALPAGVNGTGVAGLGLTNVAAPFLINSGTLTNTNNTAETVVYTIISRLAGCANGPVQTVNVVVEPTPVATLNNTTALICSNNNVSIDVNSITVPNNAADLTYDVAVSSTNAGATSGTAFTNLTGRSFGTTINGTLINSGNTLITVTFQITPKLNECANGAPVSTTVQVEPTPKANVINSALIICDGSNTNIQISSTTVPGVPGNLTFDVAVSSSNPGVTGGTAFTDLTGQGFPLTISGTLTNSSNSVIIVTYDITPKLNGCPDGPVQTTTVQVQPTPQALVNNTTAVVCNGNNVNIQMTSPTAPLVLANLAFDVAVTSTNPAALGGTATGNLSNQSFPLTIGGTLTNSSNNFITVTYTITPKLNGCTNGPQQTTTVRVEPTPQAVAVNNDPTTCNGGTPDIDITSPTTPNTPANLTFDVSVALPAGVTGTGIAGSGVTGAAVPFSIDAGVLTNSSNVARTVVYTITPKLSGCANGPVQTVNVVVEPTPQASFANNLPTVCNNGTPNITITSTTSSSTPSDLTFDVDVALPGGVSGTLTAGNGVTGATAPFSINTGALTNTTNSFQTVTYTITPQIAGCADGPTQTVDVIVEPTPQANAPVNNATVICNGGTPSIDITSPTTSSVSANLTFDVTVALPAGVTGTGVAGNGVNSAIAPFSINTGTLTNSTNLFKTVTYTITPKLNGCANGPARTATVDVEPTPQATVVNNATAICSDGSPNISVSSLTAPTLIGNLTFDVTVNLPSGVTGTGMAANGVVGATAPFSINTGTLVHDNLTNVPLVVGYTITPKLNGCTDGPSQTVNVTVRPDPVGQDDNTTEVCSGEAVIYNIQTENIDALGNGVASLFTYTVMSSNGAAVVAPANRVVASNAPISGNFTNISGGDVTLTYTITPQNASGNCIGSTFDVEIIIHSEPTAPALTPIERCSGNSVNFDLQDIIDNTADGGNSLSSKFRYTVLSSNPAAVFPGPNRNTATSALILDTYTNTSNADVVITYTVTPLNQVGDCEGDPFELEVTVHPEPVGISILDPVCSTSLNHNIQASHINVAGGNSLPSIFTYTVSSSSPGDVPPASGRAVPSSANIVDMYTNTSGSDVTITYLITPFNAANPSCSGAPFTYEVVISSKPVGSSSTATAVCSDVSFNINPQLNITNSVISTFTWTVTYDAGLSGPVSGSGTISGSLTNNTAGVKNAYYEVTPSSGTCVGLPFTITLPINPEPVISATFTTPVCSDVASNIILSGIAGSSTPDNFDVTLVSRDPDLVANPANAIMTVGTTISNVSATALQLDEYTNNHRTIGLIVEYLVSPQGTVADGACVGNNLNIIVEVLPEPVMNPALANAAICSDVANGIEMVSDGISISALTFFVNSINVQSTATAITPGSTVADVFSKLGNSTANPATPRDRNFIRNDQFTVTNFDGLPANNTVVYNVTPRSGGGCFGDAFDINLQVLPEPTFSYSTATPVCSDASINLSMTQNPTSTDIFEYVVAGITRDNGLSPGGSNISIGQTLAADASGNAGPITDTYTNGSSTSLMATYSIRPIAAAVLGQTCAGDPVGAVVTVKPSPVVLTNLDKIVCSNVVNGITISTEISSAPAQSFEIDPVTSGPNFGSLIPQSFNSSTRIVNGVSTTNIQSDRFINPTNDTIHVKYRIRANTDPAPGVTGCFGPPETITVTIEPELRVDLSGPPGNINNAKPVICSNDDTQITLISPSNPSAGAITFNFTAAAATPGTVSGLSPGANLNENDVIEQVLSNSSNNPVNVTYTVTPRANSAAGGNGCVGTTAFTTIVRVEPKPRMTASPASLTVCEGVPLGIDFSSVTVPSSGAAAMFFQLTTVEDPNTLSAPANVSGFVTTYPTNYSAGANVLNEALVNTSLNQEPVRYMFTPSFIVGAQTCTGDPVSINVMVSPRPVMTPFAVDPKCSGEPFTGPEIDFSSHVTEADLSSTLATWTFAYNPVSNMSGASNGAGFELSQVVFNKNADPGTVTYSVKARAFNCESNTIQVPVAIYPVPKITGLPNSVNVCDDGTLTVPLSSNATNTQYTWIVDDEAQPDLTGASDQLTPVNGPINYVVSNSSTSLINYTFEITPQVATSLAGKVCAGDPKQLVINVAPPVGGNMITSTGTNESFVCSGTRETLTMNFDGLSLFEAVYKQGPTSFTLSGLGSSKEIRITPTETTVFELVSVKDVFGCIASIGQTVTVNVDDTDATFALLGPVEACSPHQVPFEYDQQEGVIYTWNFDGLDSAAYTAIADETDKIIKHTFENSNAVAVAKYKVRLETKLADARYPECIKSSFHEVFVSPNINIGVFPDVSEICSGETVVFTNTSRGASTHRWFYREIGTNQELEVRTAMSNSYQLINNTVQNPITYEVVYEADNGKCPASVTMPIRVYRGTQAAFDEGTIPPYITPGVTIAFANTSLPLGAPGFTYEWTFSNEASPKNYSGADATVPVFYDKPGLKDIELVVTNTVAPPELECSDSFSKTIEILVPPLIASFKAIPLAACFPADIEIIENGSTGDVNKWQVIDQAGNIAATALTAKPIFRIVNPGTYDIFLETSNSLTNQTAFAQQLGIEIYDNPIASLEARPTTLFIPDTELITFNFSTGANFYNWDFDDGTVSEDFEPKHFYTLEGTYQITLVAGYDHGDKDVDGDGVMDGNVICYDTARREVIARQGGLTKVPNAFTPSKNGPNGGTSGNGTFNDVFLPITKGVAREDGAFILQIFDRWGTLIFESRNQTMGWDGYDKNGNLVPAGVYVFKLDLRLADGQRTTQVGDVTVIR